MIRQRSSPPDPSIKPPSTFSLPFGEVLVTPSGEPESILPLVENAVGIAVRGGGGVDRTVIEAARQLRVIGRSGVGLDNVDVEAATRLRIPVVYTPAAGAAAVAEGAMAYLLALCKQLNYWDRQLKSGNWGSREESRPGDLYGSVLGIVGLGNIGQTLAKLAAPFGMSLAGLRSLRFAQERAAELGVELVRPRRSAGQGGFYFDSRSVNPGNEGAHQSAASETDQTRDLSGQSGPRRSHRQLGYALCGSTRGSPGRCGPGCVCS